MTKIIAHRGANHFAPQNTLPAFQKAVELGAQGVENDVHLTKDGVVVICHNYDIDETSNGSGFIHEHSYEDLLRYDFGSYFSPDFANTKIPTLAEFFDVCRSMEILNVEIKTPLQKNSDIAKRTIEITKQFGLLDKLLISSFDADTLLACKEIDKTVRTALLYSINPKECPHLAEINDDPVAFAHKIDVQALHPFAMFLSEEYVESCHADGIRVNPWTINDEHFIRLTQEYGCDGIITDLPDVAKQIIEGK